MGFFEQNAWWIVRLIALALLICLFLYMPWHDGYQHARYREKQSVKNSMRYAFRETKKFAVLFIRDTAKITKAIFGSK